MTVRYERRHEFRKGIDAIDVDYWEWHGRCFNRQGASLDNRACPFFYTHDSCPCEKCDVCGYGKHSPLHGPLNHQPVGSPPYGHQFEPIIPLNKEQKRILRSLGK